MTLYDVLRQVKKATEITKQNRMRRFCLQLEASSLQLTTLALLLTIGAFAYSGNLESESNKGLEGLQTQKLNGSNKAPTVSQKAPPPKKKMLGKSFAKRCKLSQNVVRCRLGHPLLDFTNLRVQTRNQEGAHVERTRLL